MKKLLLILSVACLVSANLFSDEILIGFRIVPPYVMVDAGGKYSGIEYEIITAALAARGHTVKAASYPLARLLLSYKNGEVQAAVPVTPATNPGGFISDSYISYQNVAIALNNRHLKISSISDLKGMSIVAFQTASTVLGKEFTGIVSGNPLYREEGQQISQIRMLFGKRTDVVIGESRILNYFIKAPETAVDTGEPIDEFAIFPRTDYSISFKDQKYVADFNEGLKTIRKNGVYADILAGHKN